MTLPLDAPSNEKNPQDDSFRFILNRSREQYRIFLKMERINGECNEVKKQHGSTL